MVNRGWVPIEACKSRLHLLQFIGEGFKPTTINGVIRKEEAIKKFFKTDCAENHQPCAGGMSWQVIRPYDMAIYYFKRRFGGDNLVYRQELHGTRRYCVEMLEDMSGEDQVLVKGQALPYRRTVEELTYISLPPLVHLGYSIFWFGVALGSLWSLKVCFQQHKLQVAKAKLAAKQAKELQESISKTSQLYKEEVRKVIESKQHQQRVELPATGAATAATPAGKTTP
jgi:cytochrome oxidase assembly protein ShyY1